MPALAPPPADRSADELDVATEAFCRAAMRRRVVEPVGADVWQQLDALLVGLGLNPDRLMAADWVRLTLAIDSQAAA